VTGFSTIAVMGSAAYRGHRVYDWYLGTTANLKSAVEPALVALANRGWDIVVLVPFETRSLNGLIKTPETSSHRCDRITRGPMIASKDIFPPVRPRTVQRSIVVSCSQWQNRTV
jgi:hypothetical protein